MSFWELVIFVLGLACPRTGILPFFVVYITAMVIHIEYLTTKLHEKKTDFFCHIFQRLP